MGTDEARFTEIYRRLYPRVRAYAARRAVDTAAEEATNDAFLVAWKKFHQLPADPLPWLLVATRNALSEQRRRDVRQITLASEVAATLDVGAATSPGADHDVVERITVLTALDSLSGQDRETLMLTVWDGLPYRQAAEVSGCSTAAFAVRHHRARRRLEAALDAHDDAALASQIRAGKDEA